jgi:hypothetical protein
MSFKHNGQMYCYTNAEVRHVFNVAHAGLRNLNRNLEALPKAKREEIQAKMRDSTREDSWDKKIDPRIKVLLFIPGAIFNICTRNQSKVWIGGLGFVEKSVEGLERGMSSDELNKLFSVAGANDTDLQILHDFGYSKIKKLFKNSMTPHLAPQERGKVPCPAVQLKKNAL